jgi:hypothetical protein
MREIPQGQQATVKRRTQNANMMNYYIINSLERQFKAIMMSHYLDFTLYEHGNGTMLLTKCINSGKPRIRNNCHSYGKETEDK